MMIHVHIYYIFLLGIKYFLFGKTFYAAILISVIVDTTESKSCETFLSVIMVCILDRSSSGRMDIRVLHDSFRISVSLNIFIL